jgi:hypothetical protein
MHAKTLATSVPAPAPALATATDSPFAGFSSESGVSILEEDADEDAADDHDGELRCSKEEQCLAIFEAARELLDGMPRIQKDGYFVFNSASKRKQETLQHGSKRVQEWLQTHAPRGGSIIDDAEIRAKQLRPADGIWRDDIKNKAMRCFVIGNVKFESCLFELYESDALSRDPRFHKKNSHGQVVGVLVCCPYCRINEFVEPQSKYSTSDKKSQRLCDGLGSKTVRIGQTYTCSNPACPKVAERRKSA